MTDERLSPLPRLNFVFPPQVSVVAEQLLRLLHHCGMPKADVDFMVGPGLTMNEIINKAKPRNTLFTGSQRVAEKLAADTNGKVRLTPPNPNSRPTLAPSPLQRLETQSQSPKTLPPCWTHVMVCRLFLWLLTGSALVILYRFSWRMRALIGRSWGRTPERPTCPTLPGSVTRTRTHAAARSAVPSLSSLHTPTGSSWAYLTA